MSLPKGCQTVVSRFGGRPLLNATAWNPLRLLSPSWSVSSDESVPSAANGNDVSVEGVPEKCHAHIVAAMHANFHADEPMRRTLGLFRDRNSRVTCIDQYYKRLLEENLSLMAVDSSSGAFLGAMINYEFKRTDAAYDRYCANAVAAEPKLRHVMAVTKRLYGNVPEKVWKDMDGGPVMMVGYGITSRSDRQRGVLSKLIQGSLQLAVRKGFRAAIADSTGAYSRRALEQSGFRTVAKYDYSDYEENGIKIFKGISPQHSYCVIMVKNLY